MTLHPPYVRYAVPISGLGSAPPWTIIPRRWVGEQESWRECNGTLAARLIMAWHSMGLEIEHFGRQLTERS